MNIIMPPSLQNCAQKEPVNRIARFRPLHLLVRVGAIMILVGLLVSSSYLSSSASSSRQVSKSQSPAFAANLGRPIDVRSNAPEKVTSSLFRTAGYASPLPAPPFLSEIVETFAGDCTTPKTVFNIGDTVCVQVSGTPIIPSFPRRLTWSTADSTAVQTTDITTDPQSDFLTINTTSVVNGVAIDNRGAWQVVLTNPFFFYPEARATFTVIDAAHPAADLGVAYSFATSSVQSGSEVVYGLQLNNNGPNSSLNVRLTDAVPSGTSFVSFQQLTGPAFTCNTATGLTTCSLASMDAGDVATFLATYQVNSGPQITNTASVSSLTTTDLFSLNDSNSITTEVTTDGGVQCTISCPANIVATNDPGTGGHIIHNADFPQPTTSGTCGSVSLTATPNPQTNDYFFGIGTSFVTASTESGETCTFTVTINDFENPTISCPADITTFESSPGSGSRTVNYSVNADDNSGSVTIDCGAHPSGSDFPVGTTQVTCVATDISNNSSPSCTFNVTVNTVTAGCTLTPPSPITVDSDANACGTHVTFEVTPSASGCGTVTCDHPSGSFFPGGVTVVTCTSSPDGNSTSFTVTVNDTTAPVPDLSSLPTVTGDCVANAGIPTVINTPSGPKTVSEPPTATDNCGGKIEGTTTDPTTYDQPGTFTVHWFYTDAAGNSSSQNQTITVTGTDTHPPVPDLVTLPTVTDECSATVTTAPTATDDCTGTVTGTTPDPLTYVGVGTYTVHWTYTDGVGHSVLQNQTVVVTDTHAPTIALVGGSVVTVECHTSFSDPGVTTTDNCMPKNVTVTTVGSVNINVPNTYTITYTATDGGGNQASVDRTVIVHDTIAPTITCPGNISNVPTEPGICAAHVNPGAPTAMDTCDSNPSVAGVRSDGQALSDTYPKGTTTITWTATDASGNHSSSCQQTITVVDNEPPTITCQADIIADFDPAVNGAVVTYTAPVGTDNCPGANTVRTAGLASGATFPLGTTTNTFTVTDAAGHTASCSFKVTVAVTSIIGLDSVSITGSGLVDSYNSTGGYPATKGSLANVLSNGTITIGGSSKVFGNVRSTRVGVSLTGTAQVTGNATAGTTVSKAASAVVGGTITNNALAPFMTLPSVPVCSPFSSTSGITGTYTYNASTGDLSLSGINTATLANGNYCFHNVSLTNSAQLKVNGPVTIRLTGTLTTSGATSLPNTTLIPSNLRILSSYTGATGVTLGNSSSLQLVIYSPQTGVSITGSAPLFGTVAAKTITLTNSGMIHYDTQLKTIWPDIWTLILGP